MRGYGEAVIPRLVARPERSSRRAAGEGAAGVSCNGEMTTPSIGSPARRRGVTKVRPGSWSTEP